VASNIAVHAFGAAAVSASAVGSIAYRTGTVIHEQQFTWLTRSGARSGTVGLPNLGGPPNLALSPNGREVAFSRTTDGNTDLWISDVDRGVPTRFTRDATPEICPVWSPNGRMLLFSKPPGSDTFSLHVQPTNVEGTAMPLMKRATPAISMDWSRDDQYVLYRVNSPATNWDIWALPMKSERTPFPVVQTASDERTARFSPDGRWITYESNESGQFEIYLRPFPGPGVSIRVSTGGGVQPRWRSNGSELFYVTPDSRLMAVPVRLPSKGTDVKLGSPVALFSVRITSTVQGGVTHEYDVTADGQRFLVNTHLEQTTAPISLILYRKPLPQ
jgi:dipeptidyl aminopeptidase/acylaminoacyl peptidase